MANIAYTPLKSAFSRIYLIEGQARGDHKPSYQGNMRSTGLTAGFGDVERIEAPDSAQYGKFVEVGEIVGATERPGVSLEGRYAMDVQSTLLRLAREGCLTDVQLHLGQCEDPQDFDAFKKIVILEGARITNYETDDMGAMESGDNAAVNETAEISAKEMYEIVPIGFGVKAASLVTNEVLDVIVCDSKSCGECEDESDGCQKIFALTSSAGGSPSTPADIVYSIDGGVTWYAHDIDSLGAAEAPSQIDCLGSNIVVVSNASCSLHYSAKADYDGITDPTWTEVATGFVATGCPNGIFTIEDISFIVGDNGYIYLLEDPSAGVTVLDAGSATGSKLTKVHAMSKTMAVAVGNNGAIVFTTNGETWSLSPTSPVGYAVNLTAVWVKSEFEWWVGTSTGELYYTTNAGKTWTLKGFYQSGSGAVRDIFFSTDSVGYLAHSTATPRGRILRTYNGGYSWKVTPEATGNLTANDRINALGGCEFNPNFVVGVGLADDAADGFVVVGSA